MRAVPITGTTILMSVDILRRVVSSGSVFACGVVVLSLWYVVLCDAGGRLTWIDVAELIELVLLR